MNIELRNLKHSAFASQETFCMEATIYVDGKKAGTAENDGRGGQTMIWPRDLQQRLTEYAKSLPGASQYEPAEAMIDQMVADLLLLRDYRRAVKSKIVFIDDKGECRQTTKRTPEQMARDVSCGEHLIHKLPKQWNAKVVLNVLPEAEALPLYAKAAGGTLFRVPASASTESPVKPVDMRGQPHGPTARPAPAAASVSNATILAALRTLNEATGREFVVRSDRAKNLSRLEVASQAPGARRRTFTPVTEWLPAVLVLVEMKSRAAAASRDRAA